MTAVYKLFSKNYSPLKLRSNRIHNAVPPFVASENRPVFRAEPQSEPRE